MNSWKPKNILATSDTNLEPSHLQLYLYLQLIIHFNFFKINYYISETLIFSSKGLFLKKNYHKFLRIRWVIPSSTLSEVAFEKLLFQSSCCENWVQTKALKYQRNLFPTVVDGRELKLQVGNGLNRCPTKRLRSAMSFKYAIFHM